jgi:hypothetical protein
VSIANVTPNDIGSEKRYLLFALLSHPVLNLAQPANHIDNNPATRVTITHNQLNILATG